MKIRTSYTVAIKQQLQVRKQEDGLFVTKKYAVDSRLMEQTAAIGLAAMRFCVSVFLEEWETIGMLSGQKQHRAADLLIHSTADNVARYPEFDREFVNFPSYTRRTVISDALGKVSSYLSNRDNWLALSPTERGREPSVGFPGWYALSFYAQERKMDRLTEGQVGLKLYDGKSWGWHYFQISQADASYLSALCRTRRMLSPVLEKVHKRYRIRFTFEEERDLVQDTEKLSYRILAVDLGINAAASWCVLTADGTVHAKGVIHLACEEDRLNRQIHRKRKYQKAGKKKCHCAYRWIKDANKRLSIETTKALMDVAVLYSVDCIVFEHLDRGSRVKGRRFRERIHLWRKNDVQHRVELQAHRHGMRISRVCAWNTSRLAFDGSGPVDRHSVYHYEHGKKVYNYSLCTFSSGKVYNCDLSAAQNIGARFFLREYEKTGVEGLPSTPQRTLCTLRLLASNGLPEVPAA